MLSNVVGRRLPFRAGGGGRGGVMGGCLLFNCLFRTR